MALSDLFKKKPGEPTLRDIHEMQARFDKALEAGDVDGANRIITEWESDHGMVPPTVSAPTALPKIPAPLMWRDLLEDDEETGKPTWEVKPADKDWPRTHGDGLQFVDGSFTCKRCPAESSDRSIMDEEGCCAVGSEMPIARRATPRREAVMTEDGYELVRMDGEGSAVVLDADGGEDAVISEVRTGALWMGIVGPGNIKIVFEPDKGTKNQTKFGVTGHAARLSVALRLDKRIIGYALELEGPVSPGSTVTVDWADWLLLQRGKHPAA